MSNILNDIGGGNLGGYAGAAGSVLGGASTYMGGMKEASVDAGAAARSEVASQLKLRQQERNSFMVQSKANAVIGQQGWEAGSGSAAAILRSNAANLALDHGILQAQGSEVTSQYLTAASAAKSKAMGGFAKAVIGAVGIIAAPFTGGASLTIAGAATAAM